MVSPVSIPLSDAIQMVSFVAPRTQKEVSLADMFIIMVFPHIIRALVIGTAFLFILKFVTTLNRRDIRVAFTHRFPKRQG